MKISHSFPLAVLVAILFTQALPSAHAQVTTVARYSLGDHDFNAPGRDFIIRNTWDIVGTNQLSAVGAPRYSYDVSPDAERSSGTRLCASLNGSGQYLIGPTVTTATDNFGMEAWVRPNSSSGIHIVAYNGNTSTSGWGLVQSDSTFKVLFGGVALWGSSREIPAGVWTHLAVVRQAGVSLFLVNGQLRDNTPTSPAPLVAGGFAIGAPGQGGSTENFDGLIDDVRVFTFAPGEFRADQLLFNQRHPTATVSTVNDFTDDRMKLQGAVNPNGLPTVAWFRWGASFNLDHVTPAVNLGEPLNVDRMLSNTVTGLIPGVNYHVQLVASNSAGLGSSAAVPVTTTPTNAFGTAVSLNGLGQYALLPSDTYFDGDFTIEAWVYVRRYEGTTTLLDFGNDPIEDTVALELDGATLARPILYTYSGSTGSSVTCLDRMPLQRWVHLAATLNGTVGTLYMDGVPVGGYTQCQVPRGVLRTQNFIGKTIRSNHKSPDVLVDEIRIWNVARSGAEIGAAMRHPLSGGEPGLLVYYRCDDSPESGALIDLADAGGASSGVLLSGSSLIPSLAFPPSASPLGAVVGEGVALGASVNPGGADTTVWFEWGLTPSYGNVSPPSPQGAGATDRPVSTVLLNVSPDTVYHYRAVATNVLGRVETPDQVFARSVVVRNTRDSGPGSLREALSLAASYATVTFDPNLQGQTITNLSDELVIDRSLYLEGPVGPQMIISGNHAHRAFRVTGPFVTIQNLTIANGQTATSPDAPLLDRSGGGLLSTANLFLRNCFFTDNVAAKNGGAIAFSSDGALIRGEMEACTFTANRVSAHGNGNAIAVGTFIAGLTNPVSLLIRTSTFDGNRPLPADANNGIWGGAVASAGLHVGFQSCTVTRNTADLGGGVFVQSGDVSLENTILAGNQATQTGPDIERRDATYSAIRSLGHNLIGNPSGLGRNSFTPGINSDLVGTSTAPLDPGLSPLADHGGMVWTCALLPGSPALDAGGDELIDTDQRGLPRPSGPHADIGAFEFQVATAPVAITLFPPTLLGNGEVRLSFTNLPGRLFTVEAATQLSSSASFWNAIGQAVEAEPGYYQFNDRGAHRGRPRFYRVRQGTNPF